MKRALLALAAAALAALVAWRVIGEGEGGGAVEERPAPPAPVVRVVGPEPVAPRAGGVHPGASLVAPPSRLPTRDITDTGSVRVRLLPAEGLVVPASVGLFVEPIGMGLSPYAAPLPEKQEDGSWLFVGLPIGRYRVRVVADGAVDAVAETRIPRDVEATVEVALRPGAAAEYAATLYSGEEPEWVSLSLLSPRGEARWVSVQTSATTVRVAPQSAVRLPAKARLVGLEAGRFVLRTTSPAGETVDTPFDAAPGKTPVIEVRLRK